MFLGARHRLTKLTRGRTNHPPPTPPTSEGLRRATHDALREWIRGAEDRYARFFLREQRLLVTRTERAMFEQLALLGLAERQGPSIYRPLAQLYRLYGRFIATDLLTHGGPDQVFSLMFEQIYLVRNMDVRPADTVLELCLGSGVNSLFAGDIARSVTGVDLNPRALAFARFNEALNPAPRALEYLEGSLFESVPEGRTFDTILVNPPFELVPRDETFFLHSDGGEDGLDVVRRILEDAPAHLAPKGRFQIITWSPGTAQGPVLLDLMREAFPDHRLTVHAIAAEPIDGHIDRFASSPHGEAWRDRLRARDLCDVHFLFARAAPAATPGIEAFTPHSEIAACDEIAARWTS